MTATAFLFGIAMGFALAFIIMAWVADEAKT